MFLLVGYREVAAQCKPTLLYCGLSGDELNKAYEANKTKFARIEKAINPLMIRMRTFPPQPKQKDQT